MARSLGGIEPYMRVYVKHLKQCIPEEMWVRECAWVCLCVRVWEFVKSGYWVWTCPVGGTRSCSAGLHSRKPHCASWMLLISFLLDMAIGTMTRHLNICHKLGESGPQPPSNPYTASISGCHPSSTSGRPSSVTPNYSYASVNSGSSPAPGVRLSAARSHLLGWCFPIFTPSSP